jgi:hypothetical protein
LSVTPVADDTPAVLLVDASGFSGMMGMADSPVELVFTVEEVSVVGFPSVGFNLRKSSSLLVLEEATPGVSTSHH